MAESKLNTVKLDDGRIQDFPGKSKLKKSSEYLPNGDILVRLDFVNGETRQFTITPDSKLLAKFASHGAEQKFGDEISGLDNVEDCVLAIDDLIDRLTAGDWNQRREKSGLAGTSVLAKALVEHTGKTADVVRQFLAGKTQAEKTALRKNPALVPIIARIEAEKAATSKKPAKPSIDTDALLGEIA